MPHATGLEMNSVGSLMLNVKLENNVSQLETHIRIP